MTALIVFIAGVGLCFNGQIALGIVLILCSGEIVNKDNKIRNLSK